MAQNAQTPNDEEARKELLATIAAGRDLGPEMDQTLADRYIEQQQKAKARSRVMAPAPQYSPVGPTGQPPQVAPFGGGPRVMAPIAGVVIVGILFAAAFTGHWEVLGLLWLVFFLCGGAFWNRRRMYRANRYYRRFGPYDDGFGPGGPMQPPMMGGPQAPQQYDLPPAYTPQPQPQAPTQNAPAQPLSPTPPVNPAG